MILLPNRSYSYLNHVFKVSYMPRILVVEDEPHTLKVIHKILEREGFEVECVENGEKALEKLSKDRTFDLVILDFFMPGMSGRETCKRIREELKLKNIKIAFFTAASFSKEGHKQMEKLKVSAYIQKPIELHSFIEKIHKLVGE